MADVAAALGHSTWVVKERPGASGEVAAAEPVTPTAHYNEMRDEKKWSDEALMQQVQAKNGDALAVLFDRYYSRVLGVGLKILYDRAEAEDMLQNIFLEIYQRAEKFDPAKGTFFTWLMQYAYHRNINRKNYLIVRQFYGNLPVEDLTEFDEGALKLYTRPTSECQRFVREALAMLNDAQRRTIELVHFEGLTLNEAADRTGESLSNTRHHYYRGLAKLKDHLKTKPTVISGLVLAILSLSTPNPL